MCEVFIDSCSFFFNTFTLSDSNTVSLLVGKYIGRDVSCTISLSLVSSRFSCVSCLVKLKFVLMIVNLDIRLTTLPTSCEPIDADTKVFLIIQFVAV